MDYYDLTKLSEQDVNWDNLTDKIQKAASKAATYMLANAEGEISDGNGKEITSETVRNYDYTIVDDLRHLFEDCGGGQAIEDNGGDVLVYAVASAGGISYSASVSAQKVETAIGMVKKAVDEEVEDGYVPENESESVMVNALKLMCSEINAESESYFKVDCELMTSDLANDYVVDLSNRLTFGDADFGKAVFERIIDIDTPAEVIGVSEGEITPKAIEEAFRIPNGYAYGIYEQYAKDMPMIDEWYALDSLKDNDFVKDIVNDEMNDVLSRGWNRCEELLRGWIEGA